MMTNQLFLFLLFRSQLYDTSYPGLCTMSGEKHAAVTRRDTSERGSKMTSGFSGKVG